MQTYKAMSVGMSTKNIPNMEAMGKRIKEFRIRNGMTLVQLSEIIGISHGSLSGLENGKSKPSAETLANFCLNTEIDIRWLLTGKEANSKKDVSKIKKFEILTQAEEWLTQEVKKNPKREVWFEVEFEKAFEEFKKWKEEKEESEEREASIANRKVA
jgi:transcriptional regulator with XRE-family HTH domain